MHRKIITTVAFVAAALTLVACNTMSGMSGPAQNNQNPAHNQHD
ncbi:putative membrane protein [Asticcacaulis biprosthecium C19]|uniref:Putative membrane protein n=1 Tax=Asticcacaulis biprosthecium C19 TaxID=715226 RepID=F4QPZ5_9CAUL|nr:hypothetical protein [Asticcacaulis biprosthecium]EGF90282.1 putative membrane protein [Asticcacaulis biprosthecium C19]